MPKQTVEASENAFSLEALRKGCRKLFDVSQSTFDGATCNLDSTKSYMIEEIKETISKWKERSVK